MAVYIDADHHRAGVGRALYTQLFAQLRAIGLWTLCAGITQPNDASNGLHRTMGFVPVGTYRRRAVETDRMRRTERAGFARADSGRGACPRRESNLDLPLRRRSSYPLDYEGAVGAAGTQDRREG